MSKKEDLPSINDYLEDSNLPSYKDFIEEEKETKPDQAPQLDREAHRLREKVKQLLRRQKNRISFTN